MKVTFASERLAALVNDSRRAERTWGPQVTRNLHVRLRFAQSATSVADLFEGPGRFHPLSGDRKGEHAYDLSGNMRLICQFDDDTLVVLRVEDYH